VRPICATSQTTAVEGGIKQAVSNFPKLTPWLFNIEHVIPEPRWGWKWWLAWIWNVLVTALALAILVVFVIALVRGEALA
jgi:hypothetical protein